MTEKLLGKIEDIYLGFGGYDEAMFGLTTRFSFEGGTTGCVDFKGTWSSRPETAKWTVEEQQENFLEVTNLIKDLLHKSKKKKLQDLKNVPIEATFDQPFGKLLEWRILEEVI